MTYRGAPDGYSWSAPAALRSVGGSHWYVHEITVPANTSAASALESVLELERGWVARIAIVFPPGPAGLTYMQVWSDTEQLFPQAPGTGFHADNMIVQIECDFDVPVISNIYALKFVCWNLDDTWPHTLYIHVWVIPYE